VPVSTPISHHQQDVARLQALLELAHEAPEQRAVALEHPPVAPGVLGLDVAEGLGVRVAVEAVAHEVVAVKVDHEHHRAVRLEQHGGGALIAQVRA
jgi:hypothetical protein